MYVESDMCGRVTTFPMSVLTVLAVFDIAVVAMVIVCLSAEMALLFSQ